MINFLLWQTIMNQSAMETNFICNNKKENEERQFCFAEFYSIHFAIAWSMWIQTSSNINWYILSQINENVYSQRKVKRVDNFIKYYFSINVKGDSWEFDEKRLNEITEHKLIFIEAMKCSINWSLWVDAMNWYWWKKDQNSRVMLMTLW